MGGFDPEIGGGFGAISPGERRAADQFLADLLGTRGSRRVPLPRSSGPGRTLRLGASGPAAVFDRVVAGGAIPSDARLDDAAPESLDGSSAESAWELVALPRTAMPQADLRHGDRIIRRALGEGHLASVHVLGKDIEPAKLYGQSGLIAEDVLVLRRRVPPGQAGVADHGATIVMETPGEDLAEGSVDLGTVTVGAVRLPLTVADDAVVRRPGFEEALRLALGRGGQSFALCGSLYVPGETRIFPWTPAGTLPTDLPAVIDCQARGSELSALIVGRAGDSVAYFPAARAVAATPAAQLRRWVVIPGLRDFYGLPVAVQQTHRGRWIDAVLRAGTGLGRAALADLCTPALRLLVAQNAAGAFAVGAISRGTPPSDRGGVVNGATIPAPTFPVVEPACYLPVMSEREGRLESINAWDAEAGISLGPIQFNVNPPEGSNEQTLFGFLWRLFIDDRVLFDQAFGSLGWQMRFDPAGITPSDADCLVLRIRAGTPTEAALRSLRADKVRNYRYFQSSVPDQTGFDPAFRRDLAARFRDVAVWPHVQQIILDTSARWLAPGLARIRAAGIPSLNVNNPDRDTFVLTAILLSAYVRFSGCLQPLLRALGRWTTVADKLAHWPEALATLSDPCPTLAARLRQQVTDARAVHAGLEAIRIARAGTGGVGRQSAAQPGEGGDSFEPSKALFDTPPPLARRPTGRVDIGSRPKERYPEELTEDVLEDDSAPATELAPDSGAEQAPRAFSADRFRGNPDLTKVLNGQRQLRRTSPEMTGADVRLVQQALVDLGYNLPRRGVDGIYGSETESTVRKFQTEQRRRDPAFRRDGIVGDETLGRLDQVFQTLDRPCGAPTVAPIDPTAATVAQAGQIRYDIGTANVLGVALEVRGTIFYPAQTAGVGTPFSPALPGACPVVFIAHGNHAIFHDPADRSIESCAQDPGFLRIANHDGYVYLQERLAQLGIISVSVDCHSTNCQGLSPTNIRRRSGLIVESIRHLQTLAAAGSGSVLEGHVDCRRTGLLGHSRGAEAVLVAPGDLAAGGAAFANVVVKGVVSLAPTDTGTVPSNAGAFSCMVILPAADGDVSSNEGAHFYDRFTPQPLKTQLYVHRANHNRFNRQWVNDDFPSPLIARAAHERLLTVYAAAFFRHTLGGADFSDILLGRTQVAGVSNDDIHISAELANFLTVDNHEDVPVAPALRTTTNTLGGATTLDPTVTAVEIPFSQPGVPPDDTFFGETRGMVAVGSAASGSYRSALPAPLNLTNREILVRACEVFNSASLPAGATQFQIGVTDAAGETCFVGSGPLPRPFDRTAVDNLTKSMLKTFRFPLTCFALARPGVDITRARAIVIRFTGLVGRKIAFDQLQLTP